MPTRTIRIPNWCLQSRFNFIVQFLVLLIFVKYQSLTDDSPPIIALTAHFGWLMSIGFCLKNFAVQFIWSWGLANFNYIKMLIIHAGSLLKYAHTSHSLWNTYSALAEWWPSAHRCRDEKGIRILVMAYSPLSLNATSSPLQAFLSYPLAVWIFSFVLNFFQRFCFWYNFWWLMF